MYASRILILFIIVISSCAQNKKGVSPNEGYVEAGIIVDPKTDEEEIQNLIRRVIKWANVETGPKLLPVTTDSEGKYYNGFDFTHVKRNLIRMKETEYFSKEFINNYKKIIRTLDERLKSGYYDQWPVDEQPPFIFANDMDPWTESQDYPYPDQSPYYWSFVEVEILHLDKKRGELNWKWGNLRPNAAPEWKDFRYKFRVRKENGKWKISYLHGFDYEDGIRKEG